MKKFICLAALGLLMAGCNESSNPNQIISGELEDLENIDSSSVDASVMTVHRIGLVKADNCETYRSHLLDIAAADLAQWKFESHYYYEKGMDVNYADGMESVGGNASSAEQESSSAAEYTTTNIQEEGVDEPDIVKNDGEWMYVMHNADNSVRILKAWPADSLEEVASIPINEGYGNGMFLEGNRLIVLSQQYRWWYDDDEESSEIVHARVYDVSNPREPTLIHDHAIEGYYSDARMIGGHLYMMLNANIQAYSWPEVENIPGVPNYSWKILMNLTNEQREALIRKYTPVIREYLETIAPSVDSLRFPKYSDGSGQSQRAVACNNIYIPNTSSRDYGILMLAELSGEDFEHYDSRAVADGGWELYASTENAYLISTSSHWYWSCWNEDDKDCGNYSQIHRFSLKNQMKYIGSAEVKGLISDPYWMSEYNGHLRVFSDYLSAWRNTDGAALSILNIDSMKQTGGITKLSPNEEIKSARMFGDKGYLVTFENTDPLFTFDLSNPENPKLMGELVIPGFSTYIHPLGSDALLSIGRAGTEDGTILGVQLQIFDVSDLKHPTQLHQEVIAKEDENTSSYSEALYDTHAFMYHAGSGLLSLPINMYHWSYAGGANFSGSVVYRATRDAGFERIGIVNHADLLPQKDEPYWHWWVSLDRSRFMFKTAQEYDHDAYLYTISDVGVKVSNALNPRETFGSVKFED